MLQVADAGSERVIKTRRSTPRSSSRSSGTETNPNSILYMNMSEKNLHKHELISKIEMNKEAAVFLKKGSQLLSEILIRFQNKNQNQTQGGE